MLHVKFNVVQHRTFAVELLLTHSKRKDHTGLPESYYQNSHLQWLELYGKEAFRDSFQTIVQHINQQFIPLVEKFISDPNQIVAEENVAPSRAFSPYFFYRYGTAVQCEQARQLYYESLTVPEQQQFDQAVTRFQTEPNSRIGRGELLPYLTVLGMNKGL